MKGDKTLIGLVIIISFLSIGFSFPAKQNQKKRNLKVLPLDISDKKIDSIMQTYCVALSVKCNFCHVPTQNYLDTLNFSSDANPIKENARDMMRMTVDINKNYFYFDKTIQPQFINIIQCNTCHRGQTFPFQN